MRCASGLSVSSVGSWALQLAVDAAMDAKRSALSVSSVGSWALQLLAMASEPGCCSAFQYPRSDRGHCNT